MDESTNFMAKMNSSKGIEMFNEIPFSTNTFYCKIRRYIGKQRCGIQ